MRGVGREKKEREQKRRIACMCLDTESRLWSLHGAQVCKKHQKDGESDQGPLIRFQGCRLLGLSRLTIR